jgi:hypothetical protein
MDKSESEYLTRATARISERAVEAARQGKQRVMAEATKAGMLQSGRTLLFVTEAYKKAGKEAASEVASRAFEATQSYADSVCDDIRRGLQRIRDALSDDLAEYFRKQGAFVDCRVSDPLGNGFLRAMDDCIDETIDDYRHGLIGGKRMSQDPVVSVITSVTNSPGAIVQSGAGNAQNASSRVSVGDLRSGLAEFLSSSQVQALPPDVKQSVIDVVEVLDVEARQSQPDHSKIARWGKRLLELITQLGIEVAGSALSKILIGQ